MRGGLSGASVGSADFDGERIPAGAEAEGGRLPYGKGEIAGAGDLALRREPRLCFFFQLWRTLRVAAAPAGKTLRVSRGGRRWTAVRGEGGREIAVVGGPGLAPGPPAAAFFFPSTSARRSQRAAEGTVSGTFSRPSDLSLPGTSALGPGAHVARRRIEREALGPHRFVRAAFLEALAVVVISTSDQARAPA